MPQTLISTIFQFFNIHDADLEYCESTIKFCKRVTEVIHAMNSRTPADSMSPGNKSWNVGIILLFEAINKKNHSIFSFFIRLLQISSNT